jgi:hypothetical protein
MLCYAVLCCALSLLRFCRGAHAAAVVYDVTSPESFEKAKYWISELQKNASGSIGEQQGLSLQRFALRMAGSDCNRNGGSSSTVKAPWCSTFTSSALLNRSAPSV